MYFTKAQRHKLFDWQRTLIIPDRSMQYEDSLCGYLPKNITVHQSAWTHASTDLLENITVWVIISRIKLSVKQRLCSADLQLTSSPPHTNALSTNPHGMQWFVLCLGCIPACLSLVNHRSSPSSPFWPVGKNCSYTSERRSKSQTVSVSLYLSSSLLLSAPL